MIPDYYTILELSSNASTAEVKRAYRRLARLHHPDLHGQTQDEQIKRLNEAYEILRDTHKRAAYDEQRRQIRQRAEALRRQQEEARRKQEEAAREPKLTWIQGMFGFVRELRKEMRED